MNVLFKKTEGRRRMRGEGVKKLPEKCLLVGAGERGGDSRKETVKKLKKVGKW